MLTNAPLGFIQEFALSVLEKAPVIVLGSGASAAHGIPGMWPLGQHLRQLAIPGGWSSYELQEWQIFTGEICKGADLESALGKARLSEGQTNIIVSETRKFLLPYDISAFNAVLENRHAFPLTSLYDHLFRSTHRTLNVVTTNYDRIAEYAADASGYSHFTGFEYGHLQHRAKDSGLRICSAGQQTRTVCVWKVHGSFDWFKDDQNQIIAARALFHTPAGLTPLMVTPGIGKYRLTHGEPFRTIFANADRALEAAESYFCIGYGFNDEHVQSKLIERCENTSVPLLLITKNVSPTTKKFLNRGLCKQFLTLEDSEGGTLATSSKHPLGIKLPGENIWQLLPFLDRVVGVTP
jgi:hypothetical protein